MSYNKPAEDDGTVDDLAFGSSPTSAMAPPYIDVPA